MEGDTCKKGCVLLVPSVLSVLPFCILSQGLGFPTLPHCESLPPPSLCLCGFPSLSLPSLAFYLPLGPSSPCCSLFLTFCSCLSLFLFVLCLWWSYPLLVSLPGFALCHFLWSLFCHLLLSGQHLLPRLFLGSGAFSWAPSLGLPAVDMPSATWCLRG